jgi:enoyl-CoA hydratase
VLKTYDRDGVTVVELDHGPVNALDLELLRALTATVERADSPVVLTGAGRIFSAGVDLRRIVEGADSYVADFLTALARAFLAVFTHPRPTVAAINGHAIAGGCLFALCCDTRVMAAGKIGLTELAVGVRFPRSGLEIVRYALGAASGRVVLRADTVDRDEALRLGVIDEITEPAVLLGRAVALASQLGSYPAAVYAATKCDLQRPVLEAINAGGDAAVTAAWSSPETRQLLTDQLAALAGKPTAQTSE